MSTKQELEDRVEALEADVVERDDKIKELRQQLREAVEAADDMRQHVEDSNALIDTCIDVFSMEQNDAGVWIFDSSNFKVWEEHWTLLEDHRKLVADWNKLVPRYNAVVRPRPPGRPMAASDAQVADVLKRRKAGASLRAIVAATGLGMRTVRSILAGSDRTSEMRRREFNRLRAAEYRARKKALDGIPKRITETRNKGEDLVKVSKGLGASL